MPTADVDLFIYEYDSSKWLNMGKLITSSVSKDNTYELVDFKTKESGGKYIIYVVGNRIDNPSGVGIGWALWYELPPVLKHIIEKDMWRQKYGKSRNLDFIEIKPKGE